MDDASSLAALAARVDSLERQSRRLKGLLFAAFVLVLTLAAVSGTIAQQRSISFTGPNGTVKLSGDGLYFYDKSGNARLAEYISSDHHEPVIRWRTASNKDAMYIGLTADLERPRVEFLDASEVQRLFVGLSNEQTGLVRTFTTDGKSQTSLEDTFVRVSDGSGVEQLYLGVSTSDTPVLKMFDAAHTERLYAGIYSEGRSGFSTYDASGSGLWSSP